MPNKDRIRENTPPEINRDIDRQIEASIRQYSTRGTAEISRRIVELDREWDIERWLATNASLFAFTGLTLGVLRNRAWLMLPAVVLPFLFQHAVQGWCPPLSVFRRLGVRSRREIDREKFALKAMRGDFEDVRQLRKSGSPAGSAAH